MSLYTFAAANFTTSDDLRRRPAMSKWQLVRTLGFVLAVFLAWLAFGHRSHADAGRFHVTVENGAAQAPAKTAAETAHDR